MTHTSQIEIERKYDVGDQPAPDLAGRGPIATMDAPRRDELVAVYYDTPDAVLAAARIALRRREGGPDAGWHVKLQEGAGRRELGWPLRADDADEVPAAVREAVADHVGEELLTPLAVVRNARTTYVLRDADGAALAELCDDVVDSLDPRTRRERSWREWEVELLAGAPTASGAREDLLDALEAPLLAAGALASSSSSKLARALGVAGDA